MRFKKRKIISGVIVVTLTTMCFVSRTNAEEGSNSSGIYNVADAIFLVQQNACEAHEVLYSSFEWDETYMRYYWKIIKIM